MCSSVVGYGQKFGLKDKTGPRLPSARQGVKQLESRLTMAVSLVSVCFPAACDPWLRFLQLSKPADLSESMGVLHGEAYAFPPVCRLWSSSPQNSGASLLRTVTFGYSPWLQDMSVEQCRFVSVFRHASQENTASTQQRQSALFCYMKLISRTRIAMPALPGLGGAL